MENLNHPQEQQSNVIIADDDLELNYWSKEFGIAKEELLAFVKHGGTFAAAVENYVKRLQFAV
jgi:hypothetical protein